MTTKPALRSPLVFDCPSAPLAWDGQRVSRPPRRQARREEAVGRELAAARRLRARCRRRRDAASLEHRRARSAGRRCALVRARDSEAWKDVRPLLGRAQPGVRRDRLRDAEDDLAVSRTAGQVVTWNGHVATTFFFSTSGGRTADVRDVWPKLGNVPYLRSVSDPYDDRSPHHAWGPITFDATRLAKRLQVPVGAVASNAPLKAAWRRSGSARGASTATRSAASSGSRRRGFRSATSRSTPIAARSSTARSSASTCARRRAGPARLQRRIGAGSWKTLKLVNGSEHVTVEPQGKTLYRLSAGGVYRSGRRRRGRAAAPGGCAPGTQLLTGAVEPLSRGAATVWREAAAGWKIVAHPQIDPMGRFSAPLRLRTGAYRDHRRRRRSLRRSDGERARHRTSARFAQPLESRRESDVQARRRARGAPCSASARCASSTTVKKASACCVVPSSSA